MFSVLTVHSAQCTGCDQTVKGLSLCVCCIAPSHGTKWLLCGRTQTDSCSTQRGPCNSIFDRISIRFCITITMKHNMVFVSTLCPNINCCVSAELRALPAATFLFHLISCCFHSTYQCRSTGTLIFPFHICLLAKTSAKIICFRRVFCLPTRKCRVLPVFASCIEKCWI